MCHVQAGNNITRQSVSLTNFIRLGGLAVVDLNVIILPDSIFCVVAFPPIPIGIQALTFLAFECCKLLHHLSACSLAPVVLSDVVVDPGQAGGLLSDVRDIELRTVGADEVNQGFHLS